MTNLIIDDEFKELIPPLSDDELKQLEENLLRDGIQDPLKVWNGIIVDGHNRYQIANRHGLNFTTTDMQFATRDDVKIWIVKNQLGRRNLPPAVRIRLALLAEPIIAKQAKERMEEGKNQYTSPEDKCPQPTLITPQEKNATDRKNKTNYQLAQMAGVSDKTVQRYKKIIDDAPAEIVAQVDSGEISINEGYTKTLKAKRSAEIQRQVDDLEQKAIEQPNGLFDVIVIDPPWNYGDGDSYRVDGWRIATPYPEMTQEELKAIELPADYWRQCPTAILPPVSIHISECKRIFIESAQVKNFRRPCK